MQQVKYKKHEIEAIDYLKAARYSYKKEFRFTYLSIIFSVLFSLLGIVFSAYLYILTRQSAGELEEIVVNAIQHKMEIANIALKINTLASGFFMMIQAFFKWTANQYHIEAVNFEERYDIITYPIPTNPMILKPIGDVKKEEYAKKIIKFQYDFEVEVCPDIMSISTKQKKVLEKIYHQLRYSQSNFFNLIWFGMIAVIIISSLIYGINVSYLDVIIQILIPSLSVIVMMIHSMRGFHKSSTIIDNGLNALNAMIKEREAANLKLTKNDLRNIQDFIFMQRLSAPMIPFFLQKKYDRYVRKITIKRENSQLVHATKAIENQVVLKAVKVKPITKEEPKKVELIAVNQQPQKEANIKKVGSTVTVRKALGTGTNPSQKKLQTKLEIPVSSTSKKTTSKEADIKNSTNNTR